MYVSGHQNEKGKLPKVDFTKGVPSKGVITDFHEQHDNIQFESHPDSTTEVKLRMPLQSFLSLMGQGNLNTLLHRRLFMKLEGFLEKSGLN